MAPPDRLAAAAAAAVAAAAAAAVRWHVQRPRWPLRASRANTCEQATWWRVRGEESEQLREESEQ